MTDLVPADLVVDSVDGTAFDCTNSTGQSVDCSRLHLGAGDTQSITVHFHVESTTDTETGHNTAHALSDETASDATGTASVDVVEDVHLSVTKTFDSDTVTAGGDPRTFTIDVHSGVSDADHVHVTDTVDGG